MAELDAIYLEPEQNCWEDTKILSTLSQIMAEKPKIEFFHYLLDDYNFLLWKSDNAVMNKLQIETLKFVHSSCCSTISELVLSGQLTLILISFRPTYSSLQIFGP